ncbi:Uncharacterised protein [Vibrio cholerae]|nr:Uncharacterised protein [Vibrio cholerae]
MLEVYSGNHCGSTNKGGLSPLSASVYANFNVLFSQAVISDDLAYAVWRPVTDELSVS